MNLNSFYTDYAFNPEDFQVLEQIYKNVAENILEYLTPLKDNRVAKHIENFRIIPMHFINIKNAQYDISSFLTPDQVNTFNESELSEQMQTLREHGKYVTLVASRLALNSQEYEGDVIGPEFNESNNKIIDFRIWDPSNNDYQLINGIDYYYENNRIYFLGEYADATSSAGKVLRLTDIAVDFDTTRDMLGQNLNLEYLESEIPKVEFNDFVKTFTVAAVKGARLKDVREALNEIESIDDDIEIFDRMTKDPENAKMWSNTKYGLSPFDFVVYFPANLDYYRISLICQYLHKVRHKYTNFQTIAYDKSEEAYQREFARDAHFDYIWARDESGYVLYPTDILFRLNDVESLLNSTNKLVMPRTSQEEWGDNIACGEEYSLVPQGDSWNDIIIARNSGSEDVAVSSDNN